MDLLDTLRERGFVKDIVDEPGLRRRLAEGPVTVYLGVDPTAPSLHIGNLLQLMLVSWWRRAGHRPILVLGGGTAMIGDPSGKSSLRKAPTLEEITANLEGQRPIVQRFLGDGVGLFNNADWLMGLGYLSFLRDIGRHFSVNEMVAADTYAQRLQNNQHLGFIEFNYRLLQAYDFLHLFRVEGCEVQVGGSDQWGNCVAGIDLIRRETGRQAWVVTTPLVMNSAGQKMGKTEKGALWMSSPHTSAYDYFQYWLNIDDADVGTCLRSFTFLPMERIRELEALQGAASREAKQVLAWEATCLAHGEDEAGQARASATSLFGGGGEGEAPTVFVDRARFAEGIPWSHLMVEAGLCKSNGEARRLAEQGGLYVAGMPMPDATRLATVADLDGRGRVMLRAGKKKYRQIQTEG